MLLRDHATEISHTNKVNNHLQNKLNIAHDEINKLELTRPETDDFYERQANELSAARKIMTEDNDQL